MSCYNEKTDFIHHKTEVFDAVTLLTSLGISLNADFVALDLGGGQGMHTGFLSEILGKVYCADIINYTTLYDGCFHQKLKAKCIRNNCPIHMEKIVFIESDAMNLLMRDNYFDCVFSFNAFEHIPNPAKAFSEIIRTMRPGGIAYISLDPIWTCDTGSHFSKYVSEPWAHLLLDYAEFKKLMKIGGASNDEVNSYPHAMNRWKKAQYEAAIYECATNSGAHIVFFDQYHGVSNESNKRHVNKMIANNLGYSDDDLYLRRLRWVIKKL